MGPRHVQHPSPRQTAGRISPFQPGADLFACEAWNRGRHLAAERQLAPQAGTVPIHPSGQYSPRLGTFGSSCLQQSEPWPKHLSAPAAPSTSALQPCRRVDIRTQSHLPILPTASLLGLFRHFQFASQQLPPVPRPSPQGKDATMSSISPLITFKGGICDVDVSFPSAHPHSSLAPSNRASPPAILQAIQGPPPAHARLHLPLHRRWYGSCLSRAPRALLVRAEMLTGRQSSATSAGDHAIRRPTSPSST